jgi:hypothetical protein
MWAYLNATMANHFGHPIRSNHTFIEPLETTTKLCINLQGQTSVGWVSKFMWYSPNVLGMS